MEADIIQASSKENNGGDENIPIDKIGSVGGEVVGEGENSKAVEMGEELDDETEDEVVDEVEKESYVDAGSNEGGNTGNGEVTTPNPTSRVPYVGLEFTDEDLAFQFYDEYARLTGFGIRKQKLYRSRTKKIDGKGELLSRLYVCHKAGFKQKNDKRQRGKVVKQRPEVRVGCEALMRIKAIPSGFVVDKFVESHNHELVPEEDTFTLRSHEGCNAAVKVMVEHLINAGLNPAQIFDAVGEALGGHRNVADITKNSSLVVFEDNYPSCSCGRGLMRPVLITVPGWPGQRQILVCPITSDKGVACSEVLPWNPAKWLKHIHGGNDAKVDYLQTP
ncbi:protein FAR1-RELATED SEQUENCE 5-like isoform X2 [Telopea speciosissima]|uniref:protein FAR1-RELATED SEQUENCE 5-like isoform X2 n=1 Tax=Telopea speciosissima TaxID=54955 RepID=UPI001CC4B717|nr:protein FAR1-RELATED SEQUENCE 5-like isoform X2 [Telopea speciosissima]